MKAKFYKVNKFMWSVIDVYVAGEDGYRIHSTLGIHPVDVKPFGNLGKAVKKYLVKGDGKCLWCVVGIYEDYYKVYMFAKTTSHSEFIDFEHQVAERILQEKMHRIDELRLL